MLLAISALFLQLRAIPQAGVAAAQTAAANAQAQPSDQEKDLLLSSGNALTDVGPLEAARIAVTPALPSASAGVPAPAALPPMPAPAAFAPVISAGKKPPFSGKLTDGPQRAWVGLALAQHGAAVFDAWSTRLALSRGAQELNPMLKPFAGNSSIYAAAQAGPALLDLLSHRMMTSRHAVLRKTWWIPQLAGAAASLTAGIQNLHRH